MAAIIFHVGMKFNSFQDFLAYIKMYEEAKNVILVVQQSHKLKSGQANAEVLIYDRVTYICKAGNALKSKSKGIRESSTGRMNCPFKLNLKSDVQHLCVTLINDYHKNHSLDRKTYLHYAQNIRLNDEETALATSMIKC